MSIPLFHRQNGETDHRAMVLIHGVTDSHEAWEPIVMHLRPHHHVIRLDLRGHYRSPLPKRSPIRTITSDEYRLSDYSNDVISLLDRLGLRKAILVGHSLGGLVAQEVAVRRPDLTGGLVLVASTSNATNSDSLRNLFDQVVCRRVQEVATKHRLEFPAGVLDLSMQELDPELGDWVRQVWCHDSRVHPSWCARSAEIIGALKLQTWIGALKGLLESNITTRVSDIQIPMRILHGSDDEVFPPGTHLPIMSVALARSSPAVRVYADCGHNLPWHAPRLLAEDLTAFYEELGRIK